MSKFFKTLSLIVVFVLFAAALVVQAQTASALPTNLPYGLTMQDTMATVEQKLGQPKLTAALQAGWEPGLPDEGGSPDRFHFWATYRRFGVTIIYNTPSASDKSAMIYDVILEE
jgi:hypothetical protein